MKPAALTDRESLILDCIVESYVTTGVPVGSRYLAKTFNLGVSPATIRNVMNDLEDLGYVSQPHVSAGRVPTDLGYRFYVDSLMMVRNLAKRDREFIQQHLLSVSIDVTDILTTASYVLSKISSQLGMVLEPRFQHGIFQKLELLSVASNRLLAVISIKSGLVKTILMEVESNVSSEQLQAVSSLINERLNGLTLKEVKETIDRRLDNLSDQYNSVIRLIVESSDRLFNFEDDKELHVGGTHNIVSNPEFRDQNYAARFLELFESKQKILRILNEKQAEEISISIGNENKENLFRGCSLITARYSIGNITGTLGVVGPTRMQYSKIVPLVDYMGKFLTQTFHAYLS
ncbi:MAG: heat-inducible transcriptional repressor HrcA [bacterium]